MYHYLRKALVFTTNLRAKAGGKVCKEHLEGTLEGCGHGGNDRGTQERSGHHSGEVVVVVGRQVMAVDQHVVDGLEKNDRKT